MSLMFFILPFIIAAVVISLGAVVLRMKVNKQSKQTSVSDSSVCGNLSITSEGLNYINNINSIPNDPLRDDKSITGLEYLSKLDTVADSGKIENTIISTLGGKI